MSSGSQRGSHGVATWGSPDVGTCSAAAARAETVVTPDIATDAGWALLKHLPLKLGLRAAWSVPILSSEVLGTFGTYFTEAREPTERERQLVEVLAPTAALAIERQRSDEAMRRNANRHRRAQAKRSPRPGSAGVLAGRNWGSR